jgi:hypothetical protein
MEYRSENADAWNDDEVSLCRARTTGTLLRFGLCGGGAPLSRNKNTELLALALVFTTAAPLFIQLDAECVRAPILYCLFNLVRCC